MCAPECEPRSVCPECRPRVRGRSACPQCVPTSRRPVLNPVHSQVRSQLVAEAKPSPPRRLQRWFHFSSNAELWEADSASLGATSFGLRAIFSAPLLERRQSPHALRCRRPSTGQYQQREYCYPKVAETSVAICPGKQPTANPASSEVVQHFHQRLLASCSRTQSKFHQLWPMFGWAGPTWTKIEIGRCCPNLS